MSDGADSDEREMALLRKHKTYNTAFRLKDTEKVNRVQGLANLTETELIKRQLKQQNEEVVSQSKEDHQRMISKYKEDLMLKYKQESSGGQIFTDFPSELISQKQKNLAERQKADAGRRESAALLHENQKRRRIEFVEQKPPSEDEDCAGPSLNLFVP